VDACLCDLRMEKLLDLREGDARGFYGQAALALRWICGSSNCLACALLHTLRQGLSPGDLPALSAQPQ
jgi:hypothetical protein